MGLFITFEGTEGSGKSTQLKLQMVRLNHLGLPVIETREPGGDKFGATLRELLLHSDDLPPFAELMLFLADRSSHVHSIIKPNLIENRIILCDRYIDSTVCYQGYARGFDIDWLKQLNALATENIKPHKTILLDLPIQAGLSRQSEELKDRLDRETLAFHQKVREGFLTEANLEPNRFVVVDADRDIDAVSMDVAAIIDELIEKVLR